MMIYEFIIMLLGCIYPAYASYLTLTTNGGNQQLQLSWMKYWIVFGGFIALHFFSSWLESWLPLLAGLKLGLLLWLLPSVGGGCHLVHDEFIVPLLRRNQTPIRQSLDSVSQFSSGLMRELVKWLYRLLVDIVERCSQLTLNADDINVKPRLQLAINEVIAELRAARQAATLRHLVEKEPLPELEQTVDKDLLLCRIQLAEAAYAKRLKMSLRCSFVEHLAPIKRQLQLQILEADRAYDDYCKQQQQQQH